MKDIIEEDLSVDENREFLCKLFGPDMDLSDGWQAHVAYTYVRNTPRLFCGIISSPGSDMTGEMPSIKIMLDKSSPESFMDLVFLVSAFGREEWLIEKYFNTPFVEPSHSIVEDVCRPTRGYILYNYQMQQLISLFSRDQKRVEKLRRDWNKKKPAACQTLQRLYLPDEEKSLWQVFKERALLGVTETPNMKGARLLYELLGPEGSE